MYPKRGIGTLNVTPRHKPVCFGLQFVESHIQKTTNQELNLEFFEVVQKRRSIRRFTEQQISDDLILKALEAAILAPNSSNTQTWDFHWIKSAEMKSELVKICLDQSAAKTANQLVVVTADPKLWKRSQQSLIEWAERSKAPKGVKMYYEKIVPLMYRWGFLNLLAPIKSLMYFSAGLFRPTPRGPASRRDSQEVAIKSAALAAENFVLAVTAQGAATCMMEGFDECRLKRLLKLKSSARILMVIGIGYEAERGTWGERERLPFNEVVHVH